MRLAPALVALAAIGAACGGSVTDPFRPVSNPVPSGLPAAFRGLSAADSLLAGRASVTAAGDSVVVVATSFDGGCGLRSARAGVAGGVLVVTRLDSMPEGLVCALIATGPTPFKVVVRPVPRGRYAVAVRERVQWQAAVVQSREREIARQRVTVR